jgi:hypothetical protein
MMNDSDSDTLTVKELIVHDALRLAHGSVSLFAVEVKVLSYNRSRKATGTGQNNYNQLKYSGRQDRCHILNGEDRG